MKKSMHEGERLLDASVVTGNWDFSIKTERSHAREIEARMAAIGDKDVVTAFATLGFEIFPYTYDYKIRETIKDLAAKNYSLILITEACAQNLADFLATFTAQPYPIILPIPDGVSIKGVGMGRVNAYRKKVSGAKGDNKNE